MTEMVCAVSPVRSASSTRLVEPSERIASSTTFWLYVPTFGRFVPACGRMAGS